MVEIVTKESSKATVMSSMDPSTKTSLLSSEISLGDKLKASKKHLKGIEKAQKRLKTAELR